ncbi:hypothetical protein PAXRUDRAFT_547053 [Paxillus rubicundulus Ve08.2h10]|uniref:Uncharacterized protein n=1 Tax=Paxillus rubicundulus Ve08.2h10 TaxID=930991 RepID=A0A0D0DB15_9AGAM|nr:hypothetical protein PAXRUDRAFT_547053 [Paxillus rubicundulus Ve08.2h10]
MHILHPRQTGERPLEPPSAVHLLQLILQSLPGHVRGPPAWKYWPMQQSDPTSVSEARWSTSHIIR